MSYPPFTSRLPPAPWWVGYHSALDKDEDTVFHRMDQVLGDERDVMLYKGPEYPSLKEIYERIGEAQQGKDTRRVDWSDLRLADQIMAQSASFPTLHSETRMPGYMKDWFDRHDELDLKLLTGEKVFKALHLVTSEVYQRMWMTKIKLDATENRSEGLAHRVSGLERRMNEMFDSCLALGTKNERLRRRVQELEERQASRAGSMRLDSLFGGSSSSSLSSSSGGRRHHPYTRPSGRGQRAIRGRRNPVGREPLRVLYEREEVMRGSGSEEDSYVLEEISSYYTALESREVSPVADTVGRLVPIDNVVNDLSPSPVASLPPYEAPSYAVPTPVSSPEL